MEKIKEIKALTIAQPWAECIMSYGKNVENRSWNTKYRGYFAVHASASISVERLNACYDHYKIRLRKEDLYSGSILGFARLVDVVTEEELSRTTRKWFMGDYGFVLDDLIRLDEPVKVKGALSFWSLYGRPLSRALEQLSSAQIRKLQKHKLSRLQDLRLGR